MSVVSTVNSERDLITWYFVIEGKNKERERKKKTPKISQRRQGESLSSKSLNGESSITSL